MKDRNKTRNFFPVFRSFLNVLEVFTHNELYTLEIVVSHSVCFIPKDNITLNKTHVRKQLRKGTNYLHSKNFGRAKSYRVVDVRQNTRSFTWYKSYSEMSTLQSPVFNMSTNVKKSSRLGRQTYNVFQKIEPPWKK